MAPFGSGAQYGKSICVSSGGTALCSLQMLPAPVVQDLLINFIKPGARFLFLSQPPAGSERAARQAGLKVRQATHVVKVLCGFLWEP